MSRRTARVLPVAGASLLMAGAFTLAGPADGASASMVSSYCTGKATVTCTFLFSGGADTWRVPAGVWSARFVLFGAQGGGDAQDGGANQDGSVGGPGGETMATVALTPGMILTVRVGGAGTLIYAGGQNVGGFNGGGGDKGGYSNHGGGGASDLRIGGTALTNRVLVAGGGGGGIGTNYGTANPQGGSGGGLVGGNGTMYPSRGISAGKGGTQSAGGAGAAGGSNATSGQGGAGVNEGGGGGGGYFGGGGGGFDFTTWGGGGGGSSYIRHDTAHIHNARTIAGVRPGDGLVTITYSRP